MSKTNKFILALGCFTAGVLTMRLVWMLSSSSLSGDWAQVAEVRDIIRDRYVEPVSEEKLRDGAIRGMLESLGDPYSVYVSAEEAAEFNKDLTGEYVGIGAEVNTRSGWLTIANPMEDSPALRAGLLPEDRILRINGTTTKDLPVDQCVKLLIGQPGTSVTLDVQRGTREFSLQIERARIKSRAVKGLVRAGSDGSWNYMIDPTQRIGYLRLTQFTPSVVSEVQTALQAMGAFSQGDAALRGLVLDLRFNGGGLLDAAEQIADMFLKEGIIVSTRGRAHQERVSRAQLPGTLAEFPLAILVNGESASASEVLAGALQDNNRAIVVGTRSFGKGSVQSLFELAPGSGSSAEIKLTEQGYYLPSNRSLQRRDSSQTWGVDPTQGFYVKMPTESLIDMLRVRRKLELIGSPAAPVEPTDELDKLIVQQLASPKWNDADWILSLLRDPQLAAAVKAVQQRIATGQWTPTGEALPTSELASADEIVRLRQVEERLVRELTRTQTRRETLEGVEGSASLASKRNDRDLWDDAVSLRDGKLEVRDKAGKLVAQLRITGEDLERWLIDADVTKLPAEAQPQ